MNTEVTSLRIQELFFCFNSLKTQQLIQNDSHVQHITCFIICFIDYLFFRKHVKLFLLFHVFNVLVILCLRNYFRLYFALTCDLEVKSIYSATYVSIIER